MQFYYSVIPVFLLASHVIAGDVDANDVPSECKNVCAPVVSLTSSCDKKTTEDDTAELKCICDDPRAAHSLPLCDACMTKYGKDGSDNDANDLVRSCSFTTTSYDSTAAAASTNAPANATDMTSVMIETMTMTGSMSGMSGTMTTTMTSTMATTGASGSGTSAGSSSGASPTSSSGAMGSSVGLDIGLTGLFMGFLAIMGF